VAKVHVGSRIQPKIGPHLAPAPRQHVALLPRQPVYLASPPKPHYAALKKILNAYADNLAAAIDRQDLHSHCDRALI